jgi:hypothetical protein
MAKIIKKQDIEEVKIPQGGGITSTISRDDLKTFFYLFSRRPNTISQNFYGNNIIKKDDIIELSKKIHDKLKLYQIDALAISVIIALKNNQFLEFGEFDKFLSHPFDEKEVVESIVLKYSFLLNTNLSEAPQRYSLNIRLAGSVSPMVFFSYNFDSRSHRT